MNQYLMKVTYTPDDAPEFTRYRIVESAAEVVTMINAGWSAFLIVESGQATALRPITLNPTQETRDVITLNDGVGDVDSVVQ